MTYTWHPGLWSFAKNHHHVAFEGFGSLTFQDGPIAEHGLNGTTNEEVLEAMLERLNALNEPPYNCRENSIAITHLETALLWLNRRTQNRIKRNVEGTPTP